MTRILTGLLAIVFGIGVPMASAQDTDKKNEALVNQVWFVLGNNDCGMMEYLDPNWLNPDRPLIMIDKRTGNWDFVQNATHDEATQKAIALWARDATEYHSCYKQYMDNVEKHFHLVNDYLEQYRALHNLNQSHIVAVSQKVFEFTQIDHPVSQKFGWQFVSLCGRLYGNTVTEEEARKWADCSVRYEKKLIELIEVIRSHASIEKTRYLERLFETMPEQG